MPESETLVVFRILGILAKARDLEQPLALDEIADAAHVGRGNAERYLAVLEQAGAVRTASAPTQHAGYSLTRYGLQRLVGITAT
jgi:DNA-binding IclR family transcriptional regulator